MRPMAGNLSRKGVASFLISSFNLVMYWVDRILTKVRQWYPSMMCQSVYSDILGGVEDVGEKEKEKEKGADSQLNCSSLIFMARLGIEPRPHGYIPGALPLSYTCGLPLFAT